MIRSNKKATAKDQLLRVQADAVAMVASANEGAPVERRVSSRTAKRIVGRSFLHNKGLSFSQRKYLSLRDVSDFISMAQRGKSNYPSARNTDLLPVGNPLSTRKHAMSASAFSYERARWVSSDPRITSLEVKSLVASLLTSDPGSPEYTYYASRISSLPQKDAPLVALIAAFGDGNSRAARSARARLQRRDRKGRFAWMGGGMSALVRRIGGGVNRLTGRFVAQGTGDDNTFDIEAPDGTLYRVPAGSAEAVKAVITTDESPDGYSPTRAKGVTEGAQVIDEADLVKIDAPQGFRRDDSYDGPGTKYTDDAYDVIKFDAGDDAASEVGATDFVEDLNSDKPVFAVYRRDNPDSILGASQSWADSQATIRADEPNLDKEEGRDSDPIARLTDAEFDALNDDPEFDFDKFIEDQAQESISVDPDVERTAAKLHDMWREGRKNEDGTYEPRMKDDGEGGEVDIANTNYEDLPEKWQAENRASADHVVNLLKDQEAPEGADPMEWAADEVHKAWIDRNKDWAPDDQMLPYDELTEEEKQKDRDVVQAALDTLGMDSPKQAGGEELGEEDSYVAVQDLDDFEYDVPLGAHDIDVSSDYEPTGRTNQESPDYTDDPAILAEYTEDELTDALTQALLGDDPDNPEGSGFGELEFSGGKESVPAEALYEALYNSGIDPDMAVAKIYDDALGENKNQDALTKAREDYFGVEEEQVAELPEDEGAEKVLPPAIEGASEDERDAYIESGDWTPFLQDNQEFEETGSYNLLDTDPYEPLSDEQRAEADLPDAVFDNPVDLANAVSEEDLTSYLRESIEPDSDMPGLATVPFEDEDGEIVEAYIPGEAIRDALQLQGVNTNELLDSLYAEPKEADGDKEPTDDEATEILEDMEDSILDLDLGELLKEKGEQLKKEQDLQDQLNWLDQRIAYFKDFAKYGYNMPTDGRIGMKPMSPEEIKKGKESARKELKKLREQRAELQKQLDEVQGKVAEVPETDAGEGGAKPPSGGKPSKFYAPDPDGVPDENMEYDQDYLKYLYESELEDLTIAELSDLQAMLSQIGPAAKFLVADKEVDVQNELIRRANMDDPDEDTPASDYPSTKFVGEDPIPSTEGPERRTYVVAGDLGIMSKELMAYLNERYDSNIKSSSSKIPQEDLDQFLFDHNGLYGKDLLAAMNEWRAENDLPTTDIPEKAEKAPEEPETPEAPEMSQEDKFMDEFGLDIDMSNWVQDGKQAGSNEGAFYTDPDTGMRYYVKKPKSAKHARNEALASAFYNEAGVRHGRIYIGKDKDGNEVLISPIVQGDIQELGDTDWQNDPDIIASAQNGFVMDAWLNNWDSVGAEYDNMIVKGKDVYRIDPGGALIFRAQGEDKSDTLTPEAKQIDDLRFKGKKASSVFGSMTDEQITEDAKKLVGISPERVSELVDTAFADDPETGDFIKEMLLARRKTIMDRFGLTEDDYPKGKEDSDVDTADSLPGDTPDNEEEIIEEANEADENTPFTPDGEADLVTDSATGDYTPEMKALFDIFINNPEAAKDFLKKVKEEDPWSEFYTVVDKLEKDLDKPDVEEKDIPEKASDEIASEFIESTVDELDDADQDIIDLDLEKEEFEKVDLELEDLLDDEDLGSADKVIKKILENYEAKNNGDGTFTLNSVMRDGPDGKPQKLELRIQKNKDNTFSVLFVQTTWDQDNDPLERIVDKYAPRHSFKALSNNIQRGKSWIATFEANEQLSVDKFMKLVSKNTYKKIAGDGAIDAVKATHISADGVTELKVGDRVYNWKNGKWGTVAEVLPEYFGQGKHKVKQITADGEEVYGYTDYLKVRWDDKPGKALPVVSGSVFQIDPETGFAVNNVVPTLYNSKGKPKPNQPKKPESPDPQNPNPASNAPEEPKLEPAAAPEPVNLPEPEPVQTSAEEIDDDIEIQVTDEQAQDMIDEFGSVIGGIYNYKGEDVEILNMNKDGVVYRNLETKEIGTTPLVYWNQEELDGVVDSPKMDLPSDPNNPMIGDKWIYNASDGTTTEMKLTSADGNITYQYTDKNGKSKVKNISTAQFKDFASSGKITPGVQRKISPKEARDLKEFAQETGEPATGEVPEAAPSTNKTVAEQNNDGSTPLEGFASVEDAVALVKERKKSGYQHRVTYDGDSISDMEIVMSAPTVDGTQMIGSRFRLKGGAADNFEQSVVIGDLVGWTEESGVNIPLHKRYKTGLNIKTDKDMKAGNAKYSGKTFIKTLPDGTQIRVYRDEKGGAFAFGNIVEVYSPNKNFGKSDLDEVLSELGVPEDKQSYATKDNLRNLGEKRLLEYFNTGESETGIFKQDPDKMSAYLQDIEDKWGVTPDSLVVEQAADGRMQLVFPDETVDKLIDYTGITGMYSTTGANSIATILGGANPGMQSITQRVFTGVFKNSGTSAMSQSDDMFTGGADFAYIRPIRGTNDPDSSSTRIFVDHREILKRLDIFAYPEDMWGVKNKEDYRWQKYLGQYGGAGQPDMLKQAADRDISGKPEIMVRHNIPLSAILGYVFNYNGKQSALDKLKEAGITDVNGIPIDEFLKKNSEKWYNLFKEADK